MTIAVGLDRPQVPQQRVDLAELVPYINAQDACEGFAGPIDRVRHVCPGLQAAPFGGSATSRRPLFRRADSRWWPRLGTSRPVGWRKASAAHTAAQAQRPSAARTAQGTGCYRPSSDASGRRHRTAPGILPSGGRWRIENAYIPVTAATGVVEIDPNHHGKVLQNDPARTIA